MKMLKHKFEPWKEEALPDSSRVAGTICTGCGYFLTITFEEQSLSREEFGTRKRLLELEHITKMQADLIDNLEYIIRQKKAKERRKNSNL